MTAIAIDEKNTFHTKVADPAWNLVYMNLTGTGLDFLDFIPSTVRVLRCENNNLQFLPVLPPSLNYLYCTGNPLRVLPDILNRDLISYVPIHTTEALCSNLHFPSLLELCGNVAKVDDKLPPELNEYIESKQKCNGCDMEKILHDTLIWEYAWISCKRCYRCSYAMYFPLDDYKKVRKYGMQHCKDFSGKWFIGLDDDSLRFEYLKVEIFMQLGSGRKCVKVLCQPTTEVRSIEKLARKCTGTECAIIWKGKKCASNNLVSDLDIKECETVTAYMKMRGD